MDRLSELGARGERHVKRRAFARRRHHPDAAAMHLHDLLGDGEPGRPVPPLALVRELPTWWN